jgi:hypothetical protein
MSSNDPPQWVRYLRLDGKTYSKIDLSTCTDEVIIFDHPGLGDPEEELDLSGLVQHWLYRMPGGLWIEFRNEWASQEDEWCSGGKIRSQIIYREVTTETANRLRASVGADLSIGEPGPRPLLGNPPEKKENGPPDPSRDAPVMLGGPDDNVIVWGKEKAPLPPAQYRVVKALVEAHAKGERLSKDSLFAHTKDANKNAVEDPVGALERLRRRDKDWRAVIDMARISGRGYGLKTRPPTPTH